MRCAVKTAAAAYDEQYHRSLLCRRNTNACKAHHFLFFPLNIHSINIALLSSFLTVEVRWHEIMSTESLARFESEIGQEIARVPPSTPAHRPLHIPTTLPLFPILPFELKLMVSEYASSYWLGTPATQILNFTCCVAVEEPPEDGSISYMERREPWAAFRIFRRAMIRRV